MADASTCTETHCYNADTESTGTYLHAQILGKFSYRKG